MDGGRCPVHSLADLPGARDRGPSAVSLQMWRTDRRRLHATATRRLHGDCRPRAALFPRGSRLSAAPSISSLSPTSGAVGASVTIAGTGFGATQGTSTVKFNGTTATVTSWSATTIVAAVPTVRHDRQRRGACGKHEQQRQDFHGRRRADDHESIADIRRGRRRGDDRGHRLRRIPGQRIGEVQWDDGDGHIVERHPDRCHRACRRHERQRRRSCVWRRQ